jgi:serine O-acetyltransferase
MFTSLKNDLKMVLERDPAARTKIEVFLTYPGLHAIWGYRLAHRLWKGGFYTLARWISHVTRFLTGTNCFIDHGMGVVIGETAEVGDNVLIYHGVTLGGVSLKKGKRHPTIGANVVLGAGAKVLGDITIGKGSRIGANSVVTKSVPPNAIVIGVPGQILVRSKPHPLGEAELQTMPDAIGITLEKVMQRLETLEKTVPASLSPSEQKPPLRGPIQGVWQGEDFMI